MPTHRIDTLRNQLDASQTMLAKVGSILDTLHQLAYDRATATEQIRVAGGQPDYALDTHGDPAARRAYCELAHLVDHLCQQVATKVHPALAIVTDSEDTSGRRHPYAITALEHAALLDAQARRISRGEFNPGRTETQPQVTGSKKTLAGKIKALEAELVRERRARQRAETQLARVRTRIS
jgi:hypothetical protein